MEHCPINPLDELNDFWQGLFSGKDPELPFWKNKIDSEQYGNLKDLLCKCVEASEEQVVDSHALKVAFYMAEFYKREYNGNDSTENALKSIGLGKQAKTIWKKAGLPETYLYSTDSDNKRWQMSIYVLGGFPLRYIQDKRQRFFKTLWDVYNNDDENSFEDFLNQEFNNQTFKQSLKSESGSLHQFTKRLITEDDTKSVFAEEDCDKEPFASFITSLNEETQYRLKNKISIEQLFYFSDDTNEISKRLVFKLERWGEVERPRHISERRMRKWGLSPSEIPSFDLLARFVGTDREFPIASFQRTKQGDYVCWGIKNKFYSDFDEVPQTWGGEIQIVLKGLKKDGEATKKIISTLPIQREPYVQLFHTGRAYEWSDHKASRVATCLLFREDDCQCEKEGSQLKFEGEENNPLRCVPIDDVLELQVDSKSFYFVKRNGEIEINVKLYTTSISYTDGKLKYIEQNSSTDNSDYISEDYLPVLFGKHGITIQYFPFSNDTSKKTDITNLKSGHYKLEIKHEGKFVEWTEGLDIPMGKQKIKITSKDLKKYNFPEEVFPVFYIPFSPTSEFPYPIIRTPENKDSGKIQLCPTLSNAVLNQNLDNGTFIDSIQNESTLNQDVIVFNCKCDPQSEDELHYIEIPVWRSMKRSILYKDDDTSIVTEGIAEIPFKLKSHFKVRIINERGLKTIQCRDDNRVSFLDFDNTATIIESATNTDDIQYYLAKNVFALPDRQDVLHIERSIYKEQDFQFFYWDLKDTSISPAELATVATQYDRESEMLTLDPESKYFDETGWLKKGIIFQSLKNHFPYIYCAPIINDSSNNYDDNIMVAAFMIAVEHKIYFRVFDRIFQNLFTTANTTKIHILKLYNKLLLQPLFLKQDTSLLINELQRFSNEFHFSWILLNRYDWRKLGWQEWWKIIEYLFTNSTTIPRDKAKNDYYSIRQQLFRRERTKDEYYLKQFIELERTHTQQLQKQRRTLRVPSRDNKHFTQELVHLMVFRTQTDVSIFSISKQDRLSLLGDLQNKPDFFKLLCEYYEKNKQKY